MRKDFFEIVMKNILCVIIMLFSTKTMQAQQAVPASAVDLGLSVKWASCNVGATRPEGLGNYYAWGETSPKRYYSLTNSRTYKKDIGDDIAGTQYDAAHVAWGSRWRMPRKSEIVELCRNCTWTPTTMNGVRGNKVTGPNGNSIFIPNSGFMSEAQLYNPNSYGYYWCSTPRNIYGAWSMTIGTNHQREERWEGLTIRAVYE